MYDIFVNIIRAKCSRLTEVFNLFYCSLQNQNFCSLKCTTKFLSPKWVKKGEISGFYKMIFCSQHALNFNKKPLRLSMVYKAYDQLHYRYDIIILYLWHDNLTIKSWFWFGTIKNKWPHRDLLMEQFQISSSKLHPKN